MNTLVEAMWDRLFKISQILDDKMDMAIRNAQFFDEQLKNMAGIILGMRLLKIILKL